MSFILFNDDCLTRLKQLEENSVDSIVTDPPYKLSQEYGTGADADNLMAVSCIWPVAFEMLRVAKPGAVCVMYYDTRILPLALEAMRAAGWRYLRNLTFYRRWGAASVVHGWMSTSDFILIFAKPGAKPTYFGDTKHDVFIREKREDETTGHPAQKPIDDLRHIVGRVTPPGGVVLDPFMGSGSTGKAAMLEGFQFIGIEREAEYVEIAKARIQHALDNQEKSEPDTQLGLDL